MIPKHEYGLINPNLIQPPYEFRPDIRIEEKDAAIAKQAAFLRKVHEPFQIDISTKDTFLISEGYNIPIRIYYPDINEPAPIMVHYHGGGFSFCSIDTHDYQCRYYAKHGNVVVVSVGYRLSPLFKYPAGLKDCYNALLWAYENSQLLNGIKETICVCGDSAGGNLAASVALMSKQNNGPKLSLQVLVYPATDLSEHESKSYRVYGYLPTLTSEAISACIKTYLTDNNNPCEPNISPIYSNDLSHVPPALFIIAECDALADDGLNYAHKLESFNLPVGCRIFSGMPHGFFDYPYKETFEAMDYICNNLTGITFR